MDRKRNELRRSIEEGDCYGIDRAVGDSDYAKAKHSSSYSVPDDQRLTGAWEGELYHDGEGWLYRIYGVTDGPVDDCEVWDIVAPDAYGDWPC